MIDQDQLRQGLHAGEINIEGGEQNIIDDENDEEGLGEDDQYGLEDPDENRGDQRLQ